MAVRATPCLPPAAPLWCAVLAVSSCVEPPVAQRAAAIDPACVDDGCLQEAAQIARIDKDELEAILGAELLAAAPIDNGYRVFVVRYATDGASSTATITLPLTDGPNGEPTGGEIAAPPGGFPVVVNAHGTIGVDDDCRLSGTISGAGLAGLFGARGAIGVAPDYPGLGTGGVHPYLVARSEGAAVLDGVRAARALAALFDVPVSTSRAAVVGMSQGGHAALAAAALQPDYAPDVPLRAVGVAAPASVYLEHWAPAVDVAGPHIAYHALLAYAWARAADVDTAAVFVPGFDVDAAMRRCLWSPSFRADEPLLEVPEDPRAVFTPVFLDGWAGRGAVVPFLEEGFAINRLRAFDTDARLRIYQGTDDDTVLPYMTAALVDDLRAGGTDVELVEVPGATHIDTAYGFLGALEHATADAIDFIRASL